MPLSRLAQYQHCVLRRNGVRAHWSNDSGGIDGEAIATTLEKYRLQWQAQVDSDS